MLYVRSEDHSQASVIPVQTERKATAVIVVEMVDPEIQDIEVLQVAPQGLDYLVPLVRRDSRAVSEQKEKLAYRVCIPDVFFLLNATFGF